jgi:hypothetical protein
MVRRVNEANAYNAALAGAIGGKVGPMKESQQCVLRTADDKTPRLTDLLPTYENVWLSAMESYIAALIEREGSQSQ